MSHNEQNIDNNTLSFEIEKHINVKAQKCYQCGKCTAGCPIAGEMDFPPSMVLRLLQTGSQINDEKILKSNSIWLCLTCEMCLTRCPMEIDIPSMMDYLRQKSMELKKVNPKAKNIISFHKSFLKSIKNTGRLYELGLVLDYKKQSLNLMQDISLGPKMFSKGKLHIFPEKIKDRKHIAKIFEKTRKN